MHDRRVLRFRAHYLDDPFLIDSLGGPYGPAFRFKPLLGHQEELRQDLIQATIRNDDSESSLFEEIAKERHLKVLMDKVSSLCPGHFERSQSRGHLEDVRHHEGALEVRRARCRRDYYPR